MSLLQHLGADPSVPSGQPVADSTQPRHSLSLASLFEFYTHALHGKDVTGCQLSQVQSILSLTMTLVRGIFWKDNI